MNTDYLTLFKTIAQGTAAVAEKVMDNNRAENDFEAYKASKAMRDNYQEIVDKISAKEELLQNDYGNLYIGSLIMMEGIKSQLVKQAQVLEDYEKHLIPKLKAVLDAGESWQQVVTENFSIKED